MTESYELLESVTPAIVDLMEQHQARRQHWYAHEIVPWEQGRNYRAEPWDESQCSLSPEARTSLVLNLLTEDNLPYYHQEIAGHLAHNEAISKWSGLWTAEEGQHSIAIRSYLLVSRNCDPHELEDDRMATMQTGYSSGAADPIELFAYTSAQELATRVAHRNAGRLADDEVAYELMSRIAADENHHFMFYKGAVTAMLKEAPSVVLPAIFRMLSNFEMPGVGMPQYMRRALQMAKAGVYNMRVHHDRVVQPLLRDWQIGRLTGLTSKAQEIQQKIMEIPSSISAKADRFEARYGVVTL